jgi:hypothetical protein
MGTRRSVLDALLRLVGSVHVDTADAGQGMQISPAGENFAL